MYQGFLRFVLIILLLPSSWVFGAESPMDWLEKGRRYFRADGDLLQPTRIELLANYTYVEEVEDRQVLDRTVLEIPQRLWQERFVGGQRLERVLEDGKGYLLSPRGRMELTDEYLTSIENYFCLRQLQFLVLCAAVEPAAVEVDEQNGRVSIDFHRQGTFFARLQLNQQDGRPESLFYSSALIDMEAEDEAMEKLHFSDYQTVDPGWMLPHEFSVIRLGKNVSSYSVSEYKISTD